jgi:hypothetical protein
LCANLRSNSQNPCKSSVISDIYPYQQAARKIMALCTHQLQTLITNYLRAMWVDTES